MSPARAPTPIRAVASAIALAAATVLGAREPADTTKPAPSKFPGRTIAVDQTPMGSTRTTDVVITPTVFYGPESGFGLGAASQPDGESWTATTYRGAASASRQVVPHLYVGVQGMADAVSLSDVDPGALLGGGVPGSLGWTIVQVGAMAVYDTRDRYYFPRRGLFASAAMVRADPIVGSEFQYTRLTIDVRGYHAITGEHVLAGQAWIDGIAGTAPFERVPQLGGLNILRGIYRGRFRDREAAALQGEYRMPAWHQFDAAVFAGAAAAAALPQEHEAGQVQAAGGVGLRFALANEDGRLNVRLDHGWARGGSGTYFTVGEAF